MTLPSSFTSESGLPALIRGVPFVATLGTRPVTPGEFSGKAVTAYLDSEATGTRVTLTEHVGTGTGTYEATGITVSDDGSELVMNLEDTEQLEDGVTYKLVVVVEVAGGARETIGPWDLPVKTMPGGIV